MKIKVQCPCGSRFAFEAEPVNGQMPTAINCPTCGADATALANEIISQQIASAPAQLKIRSAHSPEPAAVPASATGAVTSATPAVPPPSESRLRIKAHHPEPAPAPAEGAPAAPTTWAVPPGAKPLRKPVPRKANNEATIIKTAIAVGIFGVIFLGAWIWYAWFGSMPKMVYSVAQPRTDKGDYSGVSYHLAGPGQVLSLKDEQLALYDVAQKKQLWSVSTKATIPPTAASRVAPVAKPDATRKAPPAKADPAVAGSENAAVRKAGALAAAGGEATKAGKALPDAMDLLNSAMDFESTRTTLIGFTNDVWIIFPNRVAHFDTHTGTLKEEIPLKSPVVSITPGEDNILAVSEPDATHKVVTQISLPAGAVLTEEVDLSPPKPVRAVATAATVAPRTAPNQINRRNGPVPRTASTPTSPAAPPAPPLDHANGEFFSAGPNVAEIIVKLTEHLTATSSAMKAKGKSVLESSTMNAAQGMDAAQEVLSDMRRSGGGGQRIDDVSRYQVTLHRLFVQGIPDWTGEVIGPPMFKALKTVDLLASGNTLRVFDKSNKLLWESKLTYPVSGEHDGPNLHGSLACLEAGDTLYFADKGILTSFELGNGNARWRVTSVGISKIQLDQKGAIYLDTTTATPDTIQFSQEVDIKHPPEAQIVKVEAATGKVLWKAQKVGDSCLLSGKFVYSTRSSTSVAWLKLEEGPQQNYNIYRLNPSNGHTIWNYYQPSMFPMAEVDKNWVLLNFGQEMQVLNYFAL